MVSLLDFIFKICFSIILTPLVSFWCAEYFWNESNTATGKIYAVILGVFLLIVTPFLIVLGDSRISEK